MYLSVPMPGVCLMCALCCLTWQVLDTRQTFLNLCQGNHYQFDLLRRAKHSSMMVLYHLCNPDVPKFLSTCSNCYKEIHSGDKYHCETCTDFDLCKVYLDNIYTDRPD